MSLAAATRSETTKVFSTSAWWILAIVLVLYVGSAAGGFAALLGAIASGALPGSAGAEVPLAVGDGVSSMVYGTAATIGYVFPLLVGTLMVTAEFRHKTLTPTFLATPRRGVSLTAKLGAGVLVGLLFGVIALVAAVGPGAGLLAAFGQDTGLGSIDTWAMIGRSLLALVLWALIGVGLGALVRNQVVAVVLVLAFTQFVEPLLRMAASFLEGLGPLTDYLPGAASDALVGASLFGAMGGVTGSGLDWWGGALVLLGYTVVLALAGHLFSWRRDVS